MGMYSYFDWEDIEVKDWEGLQRFVEAYLKHFGSFWGEDTEHPSIIAGMLDKEKKTISFECWDNIKLISYWYDEAVIFLNGVAPYIEGEVHWRFENESEAGSVKFTEGNCLITTGTMEYRTHNSKDYIRDKTEIPEEIKNYLAFNELSQSKES